MSNPRPVRAAWRKELNDLLRGVAGAFLFGAPLLYTMEVWARGSFFAPPHLLFGLALTYVALIGLDRTVGFRREQAVSWRRTLADSAEALAVGLLAAALSLALLRLIRLDMPLDMVLGRIVLEGLPFSIGVGIASGLLQQGEQGADEEPHGSDTQSLWRDTLADAGATALGATVIALSIAPTDEVPTIAAALSPPWLLGVLAASLLLSYVVVFEANFVSQRARQAQHGILQSPLGETVFSYLISLGLAALLLWFFQTLRIGDPPGQWLSYAIVLGLPATLGGAAGRLAV